MKIKAFTLVELIVVITILSILATVAFISFQGYAASSRDSVRLSDIKSMEKVINLYRLTNSKYPTPNAETNITYSGSIAWTQGVFGTNSYTKNTNLSDIPVDPITKLPYSYSVTSTKQEYQMAAVLEGETSNINTQIYAGNQVVSAYVRGDYNGKILKVSTGSVDYILGVPSIIASDINNVRLETILTNQKLVYKGYSNLPASYSGSQYNANPVGGFSFSPNQVILFMGDIDILENDPSEVTIFLNSLQTNYTGSLITTESNITELLAVDSDSSSETNNYVATILNNTLNTKIPMSPITLQGTTTQTDWRTQDPNCVIADIVIGTQTWAGCNSTRGDGIEYGSDAYCYNYDKDGDGENINGGITFQCSAGNYGDSNDNAKDYYNSLTGVGNQNGDIEVDNIWGKLYTWDSLDTDNDNDIDINDTNLVCGIGYHVPSDNEWIVLENHLYGSTCAGTSFDKDANGTADGNGWGCDGLGWKSNGINTRKLTETLQLPLAGFRHEDGTTFYGRGTSAYLWSSTSFSSTDAYRYAQHWTYSTVFRVNNSKSRGFSIRCIKD